MAISIAYYVVNLGDTPIGQRLSEIDVAGPLSDLQTRGREILDPYGQALQCVLDRHRSIEKDLREAIALWGGVMSGIGSKALIVDSLLLNVGDVFQSCPDLYRGISPHPGDLIYTRQSEALDVSLMSHNRSVPAWSQFVQAFESDQVGLRGDPKDVFLNASIDEISSIISAGGSFLVYE